MSIFLPSLLGIAQLEAMKRLVSVLPPGDFAEVGVYKGGVASHLYPICLEQGRDLHLFDTFEGIPNYTEGLDKHKIGEFIVDSTNVARIHALLPLAKLYVGIYPDTHPANLPPLAFIHCDCDQYLSYRAVIDTMWPHVVRGGIMIFDDYPYLEGARKAVEETFGATSLLLCHQRYYVVKQ